MVFYRKYRSQTISELDNAKLRETLYAVFSKPEIPHAFLFTGPKGLGKTSTARIIAKVVNCEERLRRYDIRRKRESEDSTAHSVKLTSKDFEPCNICDTCISITKGNNIDILEIDGASNRGIDEIRDLREKVRLSPSSAKKKVYIIDEVHMLTTEAFNALLKTIEEPPEHVLFIFCTTEPQKVPATIISRCFHISLSRATNEELIRSFKRIVEGEKLDISEETLYEIAKLSDGGFRDGAKMLEEVALLSKDQKITKESVESLYKVSGIQSLVSDFLHALVSKDAKGGLAIIGKGMQQGMDMKYFTSKLLESLHDLLLQQMEIQIENSLKIKNVTLKIEEIQLLVSLLTKAYQEMKYAVVPQLPLEMVVIAWSSFTESPADERTGNENSSREESVNYAANKKTIQNIPYASGKPSLTAMLQKQTAIKVENILRPEVKILVKPVAVIKQPEFDHTSNPEKSLLENVIYLVKTYNHSMAAVLRGCTIQRMDDGAIIFETAYKFHKERLDDGKSKEILEKVVKEITGKQLGVQIVLRETSIVK